MICDDCVTALGTTKDLANREKKLNALRSLVLAGSLLLKMLIKSLAPCKKPISVQNCDAANNASSILASIPLTLLPKYFSWSAKAPTISRGMANGEFWNLNQVLPILI